MKLIDSIVSKFTKYREKRSLAAREKKVCTEEKWKKYCLDNYGVYDNADLLNHQEILNVFWKILKLESYDTSNFNSNSSVREPAKQLSDWDDLGSGEFLTDIEKIFGFSKKDITDDEYSQVKTFGELAELIIKKAKEKKLKQQSDKMVLKV